jgi:hypothetical protein
VNNGTENILACYGEKTIEGETYGKLLFFIDDDENCFTYDEDANHAIESVNDSEYALSEAEHEWRDVRQDVGSCATTKEQLEEAVHGLVPSSI